MAPKSHATMATGHGDVPLSPPESTDRKTAAADAAAAEDDDLVDPDEVCVFPSTTPRLFATPRRHAAVTVVR